MRWPFRRPRLPAAAAEALGVEPGERVLAWAELVGGGYAAASEAGLRVLTPFGAQVHRPWTDVDHVAWDDASRTLAVWWVGSRRVLGLELAGPSYLPEVVHERVRWSLLLARAVPLPDGRSATLVLRRAPDGSVTSQVGLPRGVRDDDPAVRAALASGERWLRDDAGV